MAYNGKSIPWVFNRGILRVSKRWSEGNVRGKWWVYVVSDDNTHYVETPVSTKMARLLYRNDADAIAAYTDSLTYGLRVWRGGNITPTGGEQ